MNTSINYCPDCGEYLGDYVNGVLYKFGRVVTEPHTCAIEGLYETASVN